MVNIHAAYLYAHVRQTGAGHQAYVSSSNDCNLHIYVTGMSCACFSLLFTTNFACNRAIIVRLLFARPVGIAQAFQRAFALAAGY